MHPGEILTGILKPDHSAVHWLIYHFAATFDWIARLFLKSEAQGAATQVYAALKASRAHFGYYENCNLSSHYTPWAIELANDPVRGKAFWDRSAALVQAALDKLSARDTSHNCQSSRSTLCKICVRRVQTRSWC